MVQDSSGSWGANVNLFPRRTIEAKLPIGITIGQVTVGEGTAPVEGPLPPASEKPPASTAKVRIELSTIVLVMTIGLVAVLVVFAIGALQLASQQLPIPNFIENGFFTIGGYLGGAIASFFGIKATVEP